MKLSKKIQIQRDKRTAILKTISLAKERGFKLAWSLDFIDDMINRKLDYYIWGNAKFLYSLFGEDSREIYKKMLPMKDPWRIIAKEIKRRKLI